MRMLTSDKARALINKTRVIEGPQSEECPIVSICVATYNHEKYIGEAINSILSQVTSYKYEIIIGDDCSTDKTRDIVSYYQKKYPEIIRLVFSEENLGKYTGNGCLNKIRLIEAAKGDYFAFLDGDDYWTCSHKLDNQIRILNDNKKYIMCCHNAMRVDELDGECTQVLGGGSRRDYNIYDYLSGTPCDSSTYVFRNVNVNLLSHLMLNLHAADWALYLTYSQLGNTYHLPECMSVWRIHSGGICGSLKLSESFWKKLNSYPLVLESMPGEYEEFIKKAAADTYVKYIGYRVGEDNLPDNYSSYVEITKNTSHLIPDWCAHLAKGIISERGFRDHYRKKRGRGDLRTLVILLAWSRPKDRLKHTTYLALSCTGLINLMKNKRVSD